MSDKPAERRKTLADPNELIKRLSEGPARRSTIGNPETFLKTLRATCSSPNILVDNPLIKINSETKISLEILQNIITKKKKALVDAKVALSRYSLIERSVSKTAAQETVFQAEKEVEDACKDWCQAQRVKILNG